jgi:hypothetical protein
MTVQLRVRGILLLSGLVCSVLPPSSAQADVCVEGNKPGSCYILEPDIKLVTQGTTAFPIGNHVPYIWHEASKEVPPPVAEPGEYVSQPGLDLSLAVGVWGVGAEEPMVLARTSFRYTTDPSIEYLFPTDGSNGIWYKFACEEGTPLCYADTDGEFDVWKNSKAALRRSYRLTQTNPGTLPKTVTHAPILVDYKMALVVEGTHQQGGMTVPGLTGKATVAFGHWEPFKDDLYNYRSGLVQLYGKLDSVECWGDDGNFVDPTGRTCAGTFLRQVPLVHGDKLALEASAELFVQTAPACEEVDTADGPQCLVKPWNASGHAIADPYLYIDPTWEYASWFKLEISADETDTVWVTPKRTEIDPETLMPLSVPSGDGGGGGDAGDSGDGGAMAGDGNTGTAGDGDTGTGGNGDSGSGTNGAGDSSALDGGTKGASGKKSGGGCQLGSGSSTFPLLLGAGLLGAALVRRCRSGRKSRT